MDAGLVAIVDIKARDTYCDFEENRYQENPLCQREERYWINFKISNTDLSISMIQIRIC